MTSHRAFHRAGTMRWNRQEREMTRRSRVQIPPRHQSPGQRDAGQGFYRVIRFFYRSLFGSGGPSKCMRSARSERS